MLCQRFVILIFFERTLQILFIKTFSNHAVRLEDLKDEVVPTAALLPSIRSGIEFPEMSLDKPAQNSIELTMTDAKARMEEFKKLDANCVPEDNPELLDGHKDQNKTEMNFDKEPGFAWEDVMKDMEYGKPH